MDFNYLSIQRAKALLWLCFFFFFHFSSSFPSASLQGDSESGIDGRLARAWQEHTAYANPQSTQLNKVSLFSSLLLYLSQPPSSGKGLEAATH